MVTFDRLHTYEKPRNKTMLLIDTILKIVIISGVALFVIWVVSEILLKGRFLGMDLKYLQIANPFGHHPDPLVTDIKEPVPVYFAYIGLLIGLLGGIGLYVAPVMINFILAPPGGKLRTLVVDDDEYADTTYECGESPIGTGQVQINLQYYSFALVFIMFDIITALTLMFAVVFSFGSGTGGSLVVEGVPFTPSVNDVFLQVGAVLFFILSPLLVLGLWLRKKAILWQ
jgi:NADH:ubiquinone oxidoreductase subunit 3 (subunit A)